MTGTASFNRNLIVGVLLSAAFVSILNQTLLLIAIPPIMHDLQINASMAQWLTTVYLLTNGILIPVTAYFIGRFSNRSLLMAAMCLFGAGTLLGAIAPTFAVLIVARIIQAAGAGIIMPLMQTVMLTMYPVEKRGAAMGMAGLVMGFAPAVGPTLSGWLIEHFSWRYLFYAVLPVSLLVLVLAAIFMRNVTAHKEGKLDTKSVVYSSLGWGGLLYGFSIAGTAGFISAQVLIPLVIGALSLFVLIRRQSRLNEPMLEFGVFQSRMFTITTILSMLVYALMIGSQILLTFYIQNVRDISALSAGLILLPGAIVMGMMSPITGKIFDKLGGRGLSISGFLVIIIGTFCYYFMNMTTSLSMIALLFALQSLGISMIMMPLTTAGMNALPTRLIAHGTAMNSTLRMVGGSIVTALLVSIMSSVMMRTADQAPDIAMLEGIHAAFLLASALSVGGFLLSFSLHKHRQTRPETA